MSRPWYGVISQLQFTLFRNIHLREGDHCNEQEEYHCLSLRFPVIWRRRVPYRSQYLHGKQSGIELSIGQCDVLVEQFERVAQSEEEHHSERWHKHGDGYRPECSHGGCAIDTGCFVVVS